MGKQQRQIRRNQDKQLRLEAARKRARRSKMVRMSIIGGVAALVAILTITAYARRSSGGERIAQAATQAGCSPIKKIKELPRDPHLKPGQTYDKYNSNPPTSGLHDPAPLASGDYDEPQPKEKLVHNLEHGHVVIHYKDLTDAQVEKLVNLVKEYDSKGIVLQPNPEIKNTIAIASWGHLRTCDKVSEPVVKDFLDNRRGKGPEEVPLT